MLRCSLLDGELSVPLPATPGTGPRDWTTAAATTHKHPSAPPTFFWMPGVYSVWLSVPIFPTIFGGVGGWRACMMNQPVPFHLRRESSEWTLANGKSEAPFFSFPLKLSLFYLFFQSPPPLKFLFNGDGGEGRGKTRDNESAICHVSLKHQASSRWKLSLSKGGGERGGVLFRIWH